MCRDKHVVDRGQGMGAYLGCTYHDLSRIRWSPNFSVTSAGDMAIGENVNVKKKERIKLTLTSWQILLVRKHEEQALLHFSVAQYPV
jgi:hypothetical protein